MFNWLRSKEEANTSGKMLQVGAGSDLLALLKSDLLLLFKHSTACPVSWAAHSQVERFRKEHPEVPIQMLPVIQERSVSARVAELTGVRHESPQVIVIKNGTVIESLSHGAITKAHLAELVER